MTDDFFKIFNLPKSYNISKDVLKQKYYDLSRQIYNDKFNKGLFTVISSNKDLSSKDLSNKDLSNNRVYPFHTVNLAYKTLNDDLERAKLFTLPSKSISSSFLEECIKLEERIESGENLKEYLEKKIEECKKNYNDPVYLCKWGYYKRLQEMANSS